jgi:MFS transporter, DHA2 family, methylenomycin A resistance protein
MKRLLLSLLGTGAGMPYWQLAPQMLLLGGGIGLTVPAMTSALLGTVDKSRSGVASGVLNASRQAGSVVGVALFGNAGLTRDLVIAAAILLPSVLIGARFLPHGRVGATRQVANRAGE